jgi:hypothetical protein
VVAGGFVSERRPRQSTTKVLTGLSCSSCGGTVDLQEGITNVVCRYCGTPVAVVGERGVVNLMVLDEVDRAEASRAIRRWFKRGIRKAPALAREAQHEESFLAWFPFLRARLDVVGCVLGCDEKRRKRGDRWVKVKEPKERHVEQEVDQTLACADMAEFGVHRVHLVGDEIQALDIEGLRARGMVFQPQHAPSEVAEELTARALARAELANRLDHVNYSWFASIRRRVATVYYPMWVVRYSFRGQTYQALIDGEDGTLAYGKAPGNHLYRSLSLVGTCFVACFVGTTMLQHLGSLLRSGDAFPFIGAVGLILAGMIAWGYRQFRHGGVVEEGTGLEEGAGEDSFAVSMKKFMDDLS